MTSRRARDTISVSISGFLRTASSIESFSIAPGVIFKVKRSHFKVKFPNFATFGPFLSLKGLEKKTQMLLKMTLYRKHRPQEVTLFLRLFF